MEKIEELQRQMKMEFEVPKKNAENDEEWFKFSLSSQFMI